MHINEFKHWLNGFLEGINRTPNDEDWSRIKKVIDSLREEVSFAPLPLPIPMNPIINPVTSPYTPITMPSWPMQPAQTWCQVKGEINGKCEGVVANGAH